MEELLQYKPKSKKYRCLIIFCITFVILQILTTIISALQLILLSFAFTQLSSSVTYFEESFLTEEIKNDIVKLIEFACNITNIC